jgi:hypothetical protein
MEYRGSLFASGYFGHFILALALLFAAIFVLIGVYAVALAITCGLTVVFLRLRMRRMKFLDGTFSYDGWITHRSTQYSDIKKVVRAYDFGYPTDRFRGGQYCVVTNTGLFWVSLLWFPPQACREFSEHVVKPYRSRAVA